MHHQAPQPVRSLLENHSLEIVQGSGGPVKDKYKKLWDVLLQKEDYEPCSLLDIEPADPTDRFRYLQHILLPVSVQLYRYSCGNYYGYLNFIWKVETTDDDKVIKAVDSVRQLIPTFSTRAMRMELMQRYSRQIKPALLRNIYSFITQDSSAAETQQLQKVDDNVAVFLAESDDPDLSYDLKKLNGRPNDQTLGPFWEEPRLFLDEHSIVHDRRHGEITYIPLAISISDLIRQVTERLPEGITAPSESWVRLQFWPTNPYSKSAMHYTGRFSVKYVVQQRVPRKEHSDSKYCTVLLQYIKEMACQFSQQTLMLSLDDKCTIPLGEPELPH